MAKFEDYVKPDNLDNEIDEASSDSTERREASEEDRIPERFRGKSREEIAQSFVELESLHGRTANEVGELRGRVNTLTELVKRPTEVAKPPEKTVVTVDQLYDNADETIRQVVRDESQSRIDALEQRLIESETRNTIATARTAFETKHPTYKDTIADPGFQAWVRKSQVRVQMAQAADAGNYELADELFSTYAELTAVQEEQQEPARRRAAVRDASLETSGGSSPAPVDKFSRSKIIDLRTRARQGDLEAERYLTANGAEIREAYAEGRIVN